MSPPVISDDDPWSAASFAVLDLEGNGHEPPDLVELAVIPIDIGASGPPRTWLVRPDQRITPRVTRIHGIKNADVASAPKFSTIADEVLASLAGRYLVAHNATVDWAVLRRKLPALQPPGVLDTLRLARALLPGQESYALGKLLVAFKLFTKLKGVDGGGPHRATYDTTAALELFLFLVAQQPGGPLSLKQLLALSQLPPNADELQQRLF